MPTEVDPTWGICNFFALFYLLRNVRLVGLPQHARLVLDVDHCRDDGDRSLGTVTKFFTGSGDKIH